MFEKRDIKMPIASINTTSGLVSALQLVNTTSNEIFATVRNNTSESEIQKIIYLPVELPKKESQEE